MPKTWINSLATALLFLAFVQSTAMSQENALSSWQVEKCRIYQDAWRQALDFFDSDTLNYGFVTQNEDFIASGCMARSAICPRSSPEIEIADALTIEMMNAGAASTFLPFRCETMAPPAQADIGADSVLCRSQLDLLASGGKLTEEEAAVYERQCTCLEADQGLASSDCAR